MCSNKSKEFYQRYFDNLVDEDKLIYQNKYLKFVGFDPYKENINNLSVDASQWPRIQFADITMYLLHTTNSVTLKEMKNHKSMESHTFLTSGNIKKVFVKKMDKGLVLLLGMVKHSQRANDDYLYNWILARENGEIINAHCTCMAGMGESCSHVGAVLFLIDAGVTLLQKESCTEKLNQWLVPHVKQVPFKRACEIDFTSAKQRKKKLDRLLMDNDSNKSRRHKEKKVREVPPATKEELQNYFKILANSGSKPVILSITTPYNQKFVPKAIDLPSPLKILRNPEAENLPLNKVLELCREAKKKIQITEEDAENIEKKTIEQAKSRDWFSQRAGRITASKLKASCHANASNPSISLLKSICHPDVSFCSAATKWGTENEENAVKQYVLENQQHHDNLNVTKSGLIINPKYPFMGASPDRLISCDCCGSGVLEVKCSFSAKNISMDEFVLSKNSPLKFCENTKEHKLDQKHGYYYQVQAQIVISDVQYSDFVVWSPQGIKIERILLNQNFWSETLKKAEFFFDNCLLPELVCNYFTMKVTRNGIQTLAINTLNNVQPVQSAKYCYCDKGESYKMVACDNESCQRKWFHFKCLGIRKAPTTKYWYCPECKETCTRPKGRPKSKK